MEGFGYLALAGLIGFGGYLLGRAPQSSKSNFPVVLRRFPVLNKPQLVGYLTVASLLLAMLFTSVSNQFNDMGPLIVFSMMSYWLLLPYWVYLDAKSRGERAWAWGLMTLFTNVMGLFSYLITRPEKSHTCKRCGFTLREDYVVCPYCGPEAGRACTGCQSMLELDWRYCPYCRAKVDLYSDPVSQAASMADKVSKVSPTNANDAFTVPAPQPEVPLRITPQ